jgi:hypothetical protein
MSPFIHFTGLHVGLCINKFIFCLMTADSCRTGRPSQDRPRYFVTSCRAIGYFRLHGRERYDATQSHISEESHTHTYTP